MNTLLLDVPKTIRIILQNYQTTEKCLISSSCLPRALLVIVFLRSFSLIYCFGWIFEWNFKVLEDPDQGVMFVWKRKWSPAVSAISNTSRETISSTQHRFALAALHTFCAANWGWPWNTSQRNSQEPLRERLQLLYHKCALETVVFLEMGAKEQKLSPGFKHFQV